MLMHFVVPRLSAFGFRHCHAWTEFEETQNLSEDILLVRRWVLNSLRPDTKLKDASPTLKALCNVSEFWSLKGMFFVENMKYRLLYQVCLICNFERYPRFVDDCDEQLAHALLP